MKEIEVLVEVYDDVKNIKKKFNELYMCEDFTINYANNTEQSFGKISKLSIYPRPTIFSFREREIGIQFMIAPDITGQM